MKILDTFRPNFWQEFGKVVFYKKRMNNGDIQSLFFRTFHPWFFWWTTNVTSATPYFSKWDEWLKTPYFIIPIKSKNFMKYLITFQVWVIHWHKTPLKHFNCVINSTGQFHKINEVWVALKVAEFRSSPNFSANFCCHKIFYQTFHASLEFGKILIKSAFSFILLLGKFFAE